jgi:4-amino-4-deoxy-L-arabinose transferase-like glycosyltransferase
MKALRSPQTVFWAILGLGLTLRILAVFLMDIQQDGNAYAAMGKALLDHGAFLMPWGDGSGFDTAPSLSHHYPPAFPTYLAGVYSVLGFGVWQTKVANLVLALVAVGVTYACTRNLYGHKVALAVAGVMAMIPRLTIVAGTGFSENLVLLLFVLTLWALLKSLEKPFWVVPAGVFAGIGILTRAGMGPFFFIAAAGGLGWRLWHRGWKATFTDPWYLTGGVLTLTLAGIWAVRNLSHWHEWQGSNYNIMAVNHALGNFSWFAVGFFFKATLFALLLLLFVKTFQPEYEKAKAHWKTEADSLLWICILVVAFVGACMAAVFWTIEQTPPFWMDPERYLVIAYVPLLWLVLKRAELGKRNFRVRYIALAAILLVGNVYAIALPTTSPEDAAAESLAGKLHPGDLIGNQGASLGRYSFYTYLPTQDVRLVVCDPSCGNATPDYILGRIPVEDANYTLASTFTTHFFFGGESAPVFVYERVKP